MGTGGNLCHATPCHPHLKFHGAILIQAEVYATNKPSKLSQLQISCFYDFCFSYITFPIEYNAPRDLDHLQRTCVCTVLYSISSLAHFIPECPFIIILQQLETCSYPPSLLYT